MAATSTRKDRSGAPLADIKDKVTDTTVQDQTALEDNRPSMDLGRYWAAILLILGGLVVLLNNLGYLPWTVWLAMMQLWPVVLIVIGLDLIFRKYLWVRVGLLIVFGLGALLFVGWSVAQAQPEQYQDFRRQYPWLPPVASRLGSSDVSDSYEVSASSFDNVTSRRIEGSFNVGKFELTDGDEDFHVKVSSSSEGVGSMDVSTNQENDRLTIKIEPRLERGFTFIWGKQNLNYLVEMGMNAIPTNVSLDLGAGQGSVNLSRTDVEAMDLDVGAGELIVVLSRESLPDEVSKIDVGVGSITLRLPNDVAISAKHDVGLGSFEVDGQRVEGDDTYETSNIDSAEQVLRLEVNVGVGKFEIIRE